MQLVSQSLRLCVIASLCSIAGYASAHCQCHDKSMVDKISQTELLVVQRASLNVPTDTFTGMTTYGCALLLFDITKEGRAVNIKVQKSYPSRALAASAMASLKKYRFQPKEGSAALLFEIDLKTPDEVKGPGVAGKGPE